MAFATPHTSLHQSAFGEIILDAENPNPDNTGSTEAIDSCATLPSIPSHGIYWCLMFARCFSNQNKTTIVDGRYENSDETTESVWGLALIRKDDSFERVGYLKGENACIHWFQDVKYLRTVTLT